MENNMTIYIDDIRNNPNAEVTVRTYDEAIAELNAMHDRIHEIILDFDHDLGEGRSGYDIAKYIVEHNIPIAGFHVHSMNPVGRANIEQLLTHYGYIEINDK